MIFVDLYVFPDSICLKNGPKDAVRIKKQKMQQLRFDTVTLYFIMSCLTMCLYSYSEDKFQIISRAMMFRLISVCFFTFKAVFHDRHNNEEKQPDRNGTHIIEYEQAVKQPIDDSDDAGSEKRPKESFRPAVQ